MATGTKSGGVLTFAEARKCVEEHASALLGGSRPGSSQCALEDAVGRVLAEEVVADRDFPPFHRAARDGYALRAADSGTVPAELRCAGRIRAGENYSSAVAAGECVEIMTGAPVPEGADAVIMVEHTLVEHAKVEHTKVEHAKVEHAAAHGDKVLIQRSVKAGENIVPAGSEARAGSVLLKSGTRIGHREVAVLASVGKSAVAAFAVPTAAVLSTGDEVVEIETKPGPWQIRNSNAWSLAAQIRNAGAKAQRLPVAPDEATRLRQLIEEGLRADLLLLSGGVSMGKYDLVETVLRELGAEFYFTGALIQPGKPVVFGKVRGKYFFGLPGNPVSTMVTFALFAKPLIDALGGAPPAPLRFAQARLKAAVKVRPGLTRFLPGNLSGGPESPAVAPAPWQGSGDIVATSRANCFLVVPPEGESFAAGTEMTVLLSE